MFKIRCQGADWIKTSLGKGPHDRTFMNIVINLLGSTQQEMSLPTENCELFREDLVHCHFKNVYIVFLVTDGCIAQVTDFIMRKLIEASNLSHTDR
jgi:hypothetical protein